MRRILVVDDSLVICGMVKGWLQDIFTEAGVEITIAENGKIAYDLIINGSYDLVIADYEMPEMNGAELVMELCELGCTTPVMMITIYQGYQIPLPVRGRLKAVIHKPFKKEQLEEGVKKIFAECLP